MYEQNTAHTLVVKWANFVGEKIFDKNYQMLIWTNKYKKYSDKLLFLYQMNCKKYRELNEFIVNSPTVYFILPMYDWLLYI